MTLALFKSRKPLLPEQRAVSLACCPVKNPSVAETRLADGAVLLAGALRVRPWFAGLAKRLGVPESRAAGKKVQLDQMGTAVWDLIDGDRSVQQIIDHFAGQFQLHPLEAEVSVTQFIRDLGRRGLIGLRSI